MREFDYEDILKLKILKKNSIYFSNIQVCQPFPAHLAGAMEALDKELSSM